MATFPLRRVAAKKNDQAADADAAAAAALAAQTEVEEEWPDAGGGWDKPAAADTSILSKIKLLIKQTPPDKWRRIGEDLRASTTYPHPRDYWDQIFALDIHNGVLVVKSSMPVTNEYTRGGYRISSAGLEHHTIETRPTGWTGREVVDPFKAGGGDRKGQAKVLADGDVAASIYRQVREFVQAYQRKKKKEFDDEAYALISAILAGKFKTTPDQWKRIESEPGVAHYRGDINNIQINTMRTGNEDRATYQVMCKRDDFVLSNVDATLARDLFDTIAALGKNAKLKELSKLLERAKI